MLCLCCIVLYSAAKSYVRFLAFRIFNLKRIICFEAFSVFHMQCGFQNQTCFPSWKLFCFSGKFPLLLCSHTANKCVRFIWNIRFIIPRNLVWLDLLVGGLWAMFTLVDILKLVEILFLKKSLNLFWIVEFARSLAHSVSVPIFTLNEISRFETQQNSITKTQCNLLHLISVRFLKCTHVSIA